MSLLKAATLLHGRIEILLFLNLMAMWPLGMTPPCLLRAICTIFGQQSKDAFLHVLAELMPIMLPENVWSVLVGNSATVVALRCTCFVLRCALPFAV